MDVVFLLTPTRGVGLAKFAIEFMSDDPETRGRPDAAVLERANQFHTTWCGSAACPQLCLGTTPRRCSAERRPSTPRPARFRHAGGRALGQGVRAHGRAGLCVDAGCRGGEGDRGELCRRARVGLRITDELRLLEEASAPLCRRVRAQRLLLGARCGAQLRGKGGEFALRGMILLDEIREGSSASRPTRSITWFTARSRRRPRSAR